MSHATPRTHPECGTDTPGAPEARTGQHSVPPVPLGERHAAQARAARTHYHRALESLPLHALVRELRALVKDLARCFEAVP